MIPENEGELIVLGLLVKKNVYDLSNIQKLLFNLNLMILKICFTINLINIWNIKQTIDKDKWNIEQIISVVTHLSSKRRPFFIDFISVEEHFSSFSTLLILVSTNIGRLYTASKQQWQKMEIVS